ncbi:MAG: hypothetical protein AAB409_05565 [Gemmatimonadota bacterium]
MVLDFTLAGAARNVASRSGEPPPETLRERWRVTPHWWRNPMQARELNAQRP